MFVKRYRAKFNSTNDWQTTNFLLFSNEGWNFPVIVVNLTDLTIFNLRLNNCIHVANTNIHCNLNIAICKTLTWWYFEVQCFWGKEKIFFHFHFGWFCAEHLHCNYLCGALITSQIEIKWKYAFCLFLVIRSVKWDGEKYISYNYISQNNNKGWKFNNSPI